MPTNFPHQFVHNILTPVDKFRRVIFWKLSPWIYPLLRDRKLRICMTACLGVIGAFAVTMSFPLWQLLLGPILLGIPHVIGDLRYLLLTDKIYKQRWFWFAVAIPFLFYFLTNKVFFATFAVLLVAIKSQRKGLERTLCQVVAVVLFVLSLRWPRYFLFGFLHMHNLIGIGIWWFWRKDRKRWEALPLLLCILGALGIVVLHPLNPVIFQYHPSAMGVDYYQSLITGFAAQEWQICGVLLFAFFQSIHYLVWIRLIPEENRKQATPRGFRKSYTALLDDFGGMFLLVCFVGLVFFIGYAFYSPALARMDYLTLISFHGFLEILMVIYQAQGKKDDLDNGIYNNSSHCDNQ